MFQKSRGNCARTTKVTKSMLAKQTRGAVLILLQLRGTVGQLSTTQQAAAPGAADADVERASAAYGVSAPGRRELFFHGHSPHGHYPGHGHYPSHSHYPHGHSPHGHSPHSHSPHSHSPQWFSQPPPLPPVAPDWYNGPTSPKTMLAVAWTIFAVAFAVYGSMAHWEWLVQQIKISEASPEHSSASFVACSGCPSLSASLCGKC